MRCSCSAARLYGLLACTEPNSWKWLSSLRSVCFLSFCRVRGEAKRQGILILEGNGLGSYLLFPPVRKKWTVLTEDVTGLNYIFKIIHYYFLSSFFYFFILSLFKASTTTQYLLSTAILLHSRNWAHNGEQNRSGPCPHRGDVLSIILCSLTGQGVNQN